MKRLYRAKDAPAYLGVDRNFFNKEIRPNLTVARIGRRVLFDRLELDAWADQTMSAAGAPYVFKQ